VVAFAPSSAGRSGVAASSVLNETAKIFTSTYGNFIQTAGIRDGASHCAKILFGFYDNLDTSVINDPEVIIKIDISNSFRDRISEIRESQSPCHSTSLSVCLWSPTLSSSRRDMLSPCVCDAEANASTGPCLHYRF
jgi:hypothetical protein